MHCKTEGPRIVHVGPEVSQMQQLINGACDER